MWIVGVVIAVPLVLLFILKLYITSGAKCTLRTKLDGKVVIVTGGNGGLGRAVAMEAVIRGAQVIIACRNKVRGEATVARIRKKTGSDTVNFLPLDLASLQSVKEFTGMFLKQYDSAYALINNAAYMGPQTKSGNNFDLCYQTNYLSHFYLTQLLILRSKPDRERPLRVINITSDSYKLSTIDFEDLMCDTGTYDIYKMYGTTKLALVWLTTELNYRYSGSGISSTAVHPGAVFTNLLQNWPGIKGSILRLAAKLLFRSPEMGAQSVVYSLLVDYLEDFTGKIICDCKGEELTAVGKNYKDAEKLWTVSWNMCGLDGEAGSRSEGKP